MVKVAPLAEDLLRLVHARFPMQPPQLIRKLVFVASHEVPQQKHWVGELEGDDDGDKFGVDEGDEVGYLEGAI